MTPKRPQNGGWGLEKGFSSRRGCDREEVEVEEKNSENSGSLSLCQSPAWTATIRAKSGKSPKGRKITQKMRRTPKIEKDRKIKIAIRMTRNPKMKTTPKIKMPSKRPWKMKTTLTNTKRVFKPKEIWLRMKMMVFYGLSHPSQGYHI